MKPRMLYVPEREIRGAEGYVRKPKWFCGVHREEALKRYHWAWTAETCAETAEEAYRIWQQMHRNSAP